MTRIVHSYTYRTPAMYIAHRGASSSSSSPCYIPSDNALHDKISHDANFVHGNTLMEMYALFEVNELVEESTRDGKGGLMNAVHVAKAHVHRENESLFPFPCMRTQRSTIPLEQ
ncbi:hypothetical protein FIBSPDRAFT_878953 [Athelia psychrophila]|uniref:Uncharacterized protein n=1 Tax=Athelia psychrophila TaxID=1759441 RepID=A0A167UJG8_9AGAM|nr:hypothetical protein FIBSPDRAFT_878953 [Fibularhizoctonia sp. CBS 109695]